MPQQTYYTPLPRRILETIKGVMGDVGSGGFATYWDGDPVIMQDSWLPALIVDWESIAPLAAPTGHDRNQNTIVIKVVLNKMDDAGINDVQGGGTVMETPTKKRLEQFILARDGVTKQYLPKTVLGVIRKNFTMAGGEISQEPTVQFGNSQRPGGDDTIVTSEAHISVAARELIQVTGRS